MSESWRIKELVECTTNGNISYGIVQPGQEDPEGIPIIRVNNFENGRLLTDSILKVSPAVDAKHLKTRLEGGEVLLTLVGSTGQTAIVSSELKGWNVARAVAVINVKPEIGSKWINLWLRSGKAKHHLNSRANTTVQKTLNLKDVKSIPVSIPPEYEKKGIEHIIFSIEDKIELIRQMNLTLEAMAQALFKSWFVDFDPVLDNALAAGHEIPEALQAKTEKRKAEPDHLKLKTKNSTLSKLFPNSFEFNETLGKWIPEGWEVNDLGYYLDVIESGRRPKGGVSKYTEGVPSVGAESIKGVGNFEFSKTKFVPEDFFEKMNAGKVVDKDVLLYKDGGKPGDFKPRIGMFGENFPFQTFGINEHVFRLRSDYLGQYYLYHQISSYKCFNDLSVMGGKAAIPGINQQEVKSLDFLIPAKDVLHQFNSIVESQFISILNSSKESLTLAKLRDILLPTLISGKLRLPTEMIKKARVLEGVVNKKYL